MAQETSTSGIEIFYGGGIKIPPTPEFAAQANAKADLYEKAERDFVAYWEDEARKLSWFKPWDKALEWNVPDAKWFVGGKLNVSYNCLDRHVEAGKGSRVAYHWEGEPGDKRTITYQELLDEVCRCANALKELGVKRGDRVAIYMPMIPELPIAMLACTASAPPITWSSVASRPRRCAAASRMPRPRCWSRRTAATAAARRRH